MEGAGVAPGLMTRASCEGCTAVYLEVRYAISMLFDQDCIPFRLDAFILRRLGLPLSCSFVILTVAKCDGYLLLSAIHISCP